MGVQWWGSGAKPFRKNLKIAFLKPSEKFEFLTKNFGAKRRFFRFFPLFFFNFSWTFEFFLAKGGGEFPPPPYSRKGGEVPQVPQWRAAPGASARRGVCCRDRPDPWFTRIRVHLPGSDPDPDPPTRFRIRIPHFHPDPDPDPSRKNTLFIRKISENESTPGNKCKTNLLRMKKRKFRIMHKMHKIDKSTNLTARPSLLLSFIALSSWFSSYLAMILVINLDFSHFRKNVGSGSGSQWISDPQNPDPGSGSGSIPIPATVAIFYEIASYGLISTEKLTKSTATPYRYEFDVNVKVLYPLRRVAVQEDWFFFKLCQKVMSSKNLKMIFDQISASVLNFSQKQ